MRAATTEDRIILTGFIRIDIDRCRNCGGCRCIAACPEEIIGRAGSFWRKHLTIHNQENCIGCKKCIKACPHKVFGEISKNEK